MAETTPPPLPPLNTQPAVNEEGSRLPPTSRFPVLVSGQVSFTTAAAIKDIEQAPKNIYRIQVELKPRTNDSTFKETPWTLVARHLLSTIQLYDDTAIIIRKKENAVANKISSPEELPENPDAFERDYAYDVKLKSAKSVVFKIIIGTRLPYWQTFRREGPLFAKLVSNEWYINYVRLENQGTVASIGHLLCAHNRYVNQEDVIKELKDLIYPTKCEQIDVRVTKSKEFYYEGNKKVRVFTRWLTIDCPVDIAKDLSNLIMERWKVLKTDKKFENYNIKNTTYVPRHRGLVNFDSRIENIGKQNEFLRTYKDVTVLTNVNNINATFLYTKEMGEIFGDTLQTGHILDLGAFLRSWKDNSTGKPAIIAIYRTNTEREYSLLSGKVNMESIHKKIKSFVQELRLQNEFNKIRVGGTRGTASTQNYSQIATKYTQDNFSTSKKFNQRPLQDYDNKKNNEEGGNDINEEEEQWKTPPTINGRNKKITKAALTFNFNDQRLTHQYRDVVVGNSYSDNKQGMYIGQINTAPTMGNKDDKDKRQQINNTVTIHDGTQLDTTYNIQEMNIMNKKTMQQILESKQFQATLAKAVAPQVAKQVSSLVAPTLKKINQIENQVGELNEYVRGNKSWQDDQTTRQSDIQHTMNLMQTSMNTLLTIFKDDKERDARNKRPAPNLSNNTLKSPTRKQKLGTTQTQNNNQFENNSKYDYTQLEEEASNPTQSSQFTLTEDSDTEAMESSYTAGEGEGQ